MGNKGYALENETEELLMSLAGQNRDMPIENRCHRIPTSGAHRGMKGDVISIGLNFIPQQICVECKRRKQRRKDGTMVFSLPEAWLDKNEAEAAGQNRMPVFIGAFTGAQKHRKFVVLDHKAKEILIKVATQNHGYQQIKSNKKGNFIIEKDKIDMWWDDNLNDWINLIGRRNWIMQSYDTFVMSMSMLAQIPNKLPT